MYYFFVLLYFLLKNYLFYDALLFIILYFYYYFDLLLLYIEQPFYYHVKIVKPIFIFGFPRSATTAFHESLYNSTKICSLTMYDTSLKSNIMKFIFEIFKLDLFIDYIINKQSTSGHRANKNRLNEEHMILFRTIILAIPSLIIVVPQNILLNLCKINKNDMNIIKMVISRKIKKDEIFVGKSLLLDPYLDEYKKVFPDMIKIYCKRDFKKCFKSLITLSYNMSKIKNNYINESNFDIFIDNHYNLFIIKTRKGIENIDFDYTIDFIEWCNNPIDQLKIIIDKFHLQRYKNIIEYKDGKSIPLPKELLDIYENYIKNVI